jgi:branched-chain amino acid transport system ATP-binding protein
METMLDVVDLTVKYGQVTSVSGVNIKVERGEAVTVLGSNGAGKSTVINTISGIRRANTGRIRFMGVDITSLSPDKIVGLGLLQVPEGKATLSRLKVCDNLKIGAYLRKDLVGVQRDLDMVYERFPILAARRKQYAGNLSGGEQRMLAIGMALMARPKLMMLDEPSLGLAPLIVSEMFKIISNLKEEGMTILLVEQNARLALLHSERGYILETGSIVLSGKADWLLNNEQVRDAYLGGGKANASQAMGK